ncbi:MAG: KEOPS complex subunit Pcc1 [Candidatus Alkanophagales archaeon]
MRVRARIALEDDDPRALAAALSPDNMEGMRTVVEGGVVVTYFEAERIGSLILSVDDYLMNAKVAKDVGAVLKALEKGR